MPKSTAVKDQLWRLIKSLNKAEKRNFKLFAGRTGNRSATKFIRLFDGMDRAEVQDEERMRRRLGITPGAYSNLKRHLYQQLLSSLRLIHIDKEIDIELREQIDFSRILYGKGHYLDALRLLERAKGKATEHSQDLLHLEIVEFQKLIEARHVTLSRQVGNKMDLLVSESAERSQSVLNTCELFNMNIQIHGRYIESGHSRNEAERLANQTFWQTIQTTRAHRPAAASTFHQKINRFQSSMWYRYIQLDFSEALEAATNASSLFLLSKHMTVRDPNLYLRCLYYAGVFAYLNQEATVVVRYQQRLQRFLEDSDVRLNENSNRVGAVYSALLRYNALFLRGAPGEAYSFSHRIAADYVAGTFRPAQHRWGLFLYKSAAAAFRVKQYSEALGSLNDIVNMKSGVHREDLLINTRLLHALCNYELGHHSLVAYHLTSLARLLRKSREAADVHRVTVSTLRKLLNLPAAERAPLYVEASQAIRKLRHHPFERKALLYLDVRQWLSLHL